MADLKDARKRSIDNLQRIYTFVVSLAVAESLRRTLLTPANTVELVWSNKWLMCISLIVTLVPFYHGANRYLDATYVTEEMRATSRYALMVDFFALFLHGLLLFGLALYVNNPDYHPFYTGLGIVLVIDAIWVFFTSLVTEEIRDQTIQQSSDQNQKSSKPKYYAWGIINLITAAILFTSTWSALWPEGMVRNHALAAIVIVRTVVDYWLSFDFYYPPVPDSVTENDTPKEEAARG